MKNPKQMEGARQPGESDAEFIFRHAFAWARDSRTLPEADSLAYAQYASGVVAQEPGRYDKWEHPAEYAEYRRRVADAEFPPSGDLVELAVVGTWLTDTGGCAVLLERVDEGEDPDERVASWKTDPMVRNVRLVQRIESLRWEAYDG